MSQIHIAIPRDKIKEFCLRRHICRLSIFGSAIRDDFRADSDVDVLIEFEPGKCVGLIKLGMLEEELSELLGRNVDLNTVNGLSPYFKEEVLEEAETVYVAA